MIDSLIFTKHALKRMAQRNVSTTEISFILAHGTEINCAGARLVHLKCKDIPKSVCHDDQFARLQGSTVVLSKESPVVMTVWRNRQKGLRHISHKPRHTY